MMTRQGAWMRGLCVLVCAAMFVGCESTSLQEERDALWQANQEYQKELALARQGQQSAEARSRTLAEQLERLKVQQATVVVQQPQSIARANTGFEGIADIETTESAGRITVRVPGDVLFSSGKVDLKSSAKKTLAQVAGVISRKYPGNMIRVSGYTDTDPIRKSKWSDNLELSLQRAAAVHRYLQTQSVRPELMYAAGYGQWHPENSKARSRRVEIVVELE